MFPFQDECDNSSQDIHWKRGAPDQCITITSVSPTSAPANQEEEVTLNVQAQLPQDEVYECVFEKYGKLEDAMIINDRKTGMSRGFGFVYFQRPEDAQVAKEETNGLEIDGTVNLTN